MINHARKLNLMEDGQILWDNVLHNLQSEFGEAIYKSWFSHLKFVELADEKVIVSAPSKFIKGWIDSNYKGSIEASIASLSSAPNKLEITVKATRARIIPKCVTNDNTEAGAEPQSEKCDILESGLDPRMTFETFVVGDANRAAYGATKVIFESGNTSSNMIYIQGKVGMGKTHLLQAIASYARANLAHKKVAYLSADKFIHLYVKSIRSNSLVDFKEKLREADYLLIDDLQFICGKAGTQHELLNAVRAFTESNRKVVVTCDTSPYRLNLDKRAISKLAGGLVLNIKPSDYDLRIAILEAKAKNFDLKIPHEVLELIAKSILSSNRELEGALNKLVTHCSLEETEINIQSVHDILGDNFEAHDVQLTIEQISEAVATKYSISIDDMNSKSRTARFVLARQIAMYLAKQLTSCSLQEIGFKIGGRDHATVIYSVRKLEEALNRNKALGSEIAKLIEQLSRR